MGVPVYGTGRIEPPQMRLDNRGDPSGFVPFLGLGEFTGSGGGWIIGLRDRFEISVAGLGATAKPSAGRDSNRPSAQTDRTHGP